jgi:ADP-ribosylglycohydrolase
MNREFMKDALLGVAVGDAIGVPVEFRSRQYLLEYAVEGMIGYGSHQQQPGAWSDDSSKACVTVRTFLDETATCTEEERQHVARILSGTIFELEEAQLQSSGYVVHTLEASLWCLLSTRTYEKAVLKAANLGEDTDTTAAVTGGLAGLLYGWQQIRAEWLTALVKRTEIEDLSQRLGKN